MSELIGFNNGVYDVTNMCFRERMENDNPYIELKYNYKNYYDEIKMDYKDYDDEIITYVANVVMKSDLPTFSVDNLFENRHYEKTKIHDLMSNCFGEYL